MKMQVHIYPTENGWMAVQTPWLFDDPHFKGPTMVIGKNYSYETIESLLKHLASILEPPQIAPAAEPAIFNK